MIYRGVPDFRLVLSTEARGRLVALSQDLSFRLGDERRVSKVNSISRQNDSTRLNPARLVLSHFSGRHVVAGTSPPASTQDNLTMIPTFLAVRPKKNLRKCRPLIVNNFCSRLRDLSGCNPQATGKITPKLVVCTYSPAIPNSGAVDSIALACAESSHRRVATDAGCRGELVHQHPK